ncbi:hypothetical protein BV372_11490 [Nostoc sp. T09]|uniref:hypothetical protein n=1 Tax=Nostoc sp. T09 TaxID=1932621 RepID=UPI000A38E392|nr:hypothetical protein [Nostoc sp. T09]OUL35459.1 hypothetical protein BV372_11490 [Nostoc sp. T09]
MPKADYAYADTHSNEERKRALPSHKCDLSGDCNELVVKSFNQDRPEKLWCDRYFTQSQAIASPGKTE